MPGPEKIVHRLVDKGWLTSFQAEAILGGRAASLLFGHYLLLARLGEGGMGAVFKARHIRLGRIDALKVIRADKVASKLVARRFIREIRHTADLNHPHIIRALDAGQVGRQLYLATEYIPGEDLTTTIYRDGPFTVADACLVIYQTALALQYIHERGLIHRDLKPSNIMREDSTRLVKLLDLGLSNSLHGGSGSDSANGNLTRDGVMLGTPDFMAPEQAVNPHGVDIRADLYGLGCTFFYLLTGRTPYQGTPLEKLLQHSSAPPPEIILPKGPTPPTLSVILVKLMAKQPQDRFQTPQELIDALLALRPGPPQTIACATPPIVDDWQSQFDYLISQDASASGGSPIPDFREARRPRSRAGWIGAAALALLAIPVAVSALSRKSAVEETTTTGAVPGEEESVDELKQLRKAVMAGSENRDTLRSRVLDYRARHFGTTAAASAAGLLKRLPSPLDKLAFAKEPTADAPIVRLAEQSSTLTGLLFSPADDRLVISREAKPPEEWELPALKKTDRYRAWPTIVEGPTSIRPDGRTVISVDASGRIAVGGDGKPRLVDAGQPISLAAIGPDGKSAVVAFANSDDRLTRISLETGMPIARLDHPSEGAVSISISPDGDSCLAIGPENLIRVLSISTGKLMQAFDSPPGVSATPTGVFGPDGHRLYLIGAARAASRFTLSSPSAEATYEVAADRANPFVSRPSQGRPTSIAVAADESLVAVGTRSGRLHIYTAANGRPLQEFQLAQSIQSLAFSTSGRVIAVGLDDGSVLLVPVKS